MSHITQINTEFKDAQAIRDAAKAPGCDLEEHTKPRYYGSAWGPAPLTVF